MALAQRAVAKGGAAIVLLGIISGALFYGDAVITPALSVLSAIEGIKLVTVTFEHYVVPLTVIILVALFAVQSRGTARVAALFGPVMCVWFAVIAIAARAADRAPPGSAAGAQSASCRLLHAPSRHDRLRHARRGVSRRHRRGGALCRPRPFRQAPDPDRVALHRAAVAGVELSGAGRAADRRSQGDRKPVLPDVPGLGADPDGGAGDGGDRDCEPGRHHRRLFADAPGDSARPDAAVRNSSYVGSPFRPDLHPPHQHAAASLR